MRFHLIFKYAFLLSLGGLLIYPDNLVAKGGGDNTLIVVPARERIIKLAIDMAQMRKNVSVATFRLPVRKSGDPVFFLWEKGNWQPVMYDDFCEMRCLTKLPGKVIIIGDNTDIPNSVLNAVPWAEKTIRIPTLIIADVINQLNEQLAFSEKEWKRLANNHGLVLQDLNAEKRNFNPYDIPRSKLPLQIIPSHRGKESPTAVEEKNIDEPIPALPAIEETAKPNMPEIKEGSIGENGIPPK